MASKRKGREIEVKELSKQRPYLARRILLPPPSAVMVRHVSIIPAKVHLHFPGELLASIRHAFPVARLANVLFAGGLLARETELAGVETALKWRNWRYNGVKMALKHR